MTSIAHAAAGKAARRSARCNKSAVKFTQSLSGASGCVRKIINGSLEIKLKPIYHDPGIVHVMLWYVRGLRHRNITRSSSDDNDVSYDSG